MEAILKLTFLCCHPAPANHFADFLQPTSNHIACEVLATEIAYKNLKDRNVDAKDFYANKRVVPLAKLSEEDAERLAQEVAKTCSKSSIVIADVGSDFTARVLHVLSEKYPDVKLIVYYDNPEDYVAGGYSETVAKAMKHAKVALFANDNLANRPIYAKPNEKIDLSSIQRIGLGYSTLPEEVAKIKALRAESQEAERAKLLQRHNIEDRGQKIAFYFGGANEVYYNEAFPHFLKCLEASHKEEALSNLTILVQQHPRSIIEGNKDGNYLDVWKQKLGSAAPEILISKASFNDAILAADLGMYHQTTANTKILLSGIPIFQVAHEKYSDVLVKNDLCKSAVSSHEFSDALKDAIDNPVNVDASLVYQLLGIKKDWEWTLIRTIQEQFCTFQ